jgi:hypothetical protein
MVTTRSGKKTTTKGTSSPLNPRVIKGGFSREHLVPLVMEEMLYEANERAYIFERELDVMTDKCKMLEEELMNVRFKHVQEIKKFERESKNRSFYFTREPKVPSNTLLQFMGLKGDVVPLIFWLLCSLLLNSTYIYYAMPIFE